MMIQFRTLFTLRVSHAYYAENCEDFDFVVPGATARLLAGGKLLAKMLGGKLHVLCEADESGAPLVSTAGTKLRIGLRLCNPFFINFTRLDFDPRSVTPLYRNVAAPAVLDAPEQVVLIGRLLSHRFSKAARPVTAILKDADGEIVLDSAVYAFADGATVSYDLTGQSPALYKVEEIYPADTGSVLYYSDLELTRLGIFAVVEIKIDPGFYAAAPDFVLRFDAKEETLKYYLVAKSYSDAEFNQLAVADAGFSDDGRPQLNFAKVAPAAFTAAEITPGLLAEPGSKLALFKSQTTVARREKARKKIQLKRNGEILIEHLPQPRVDKPNSDLIIQISKT